MGYYPTKKDVGIFRFAIPFLKDGLERNKIFLLLENEEGIDKAKLIHISVLSLESILKAILLLSFYNEYSDGKIRKWLKNYGHNINNMYSRIASKYSIKLPANEKMLLKKWNNFGIESRYKIDAFFNSIDVNWIHADRHKGVKDTINDDLFMYKNIFINIYNLCTSIIENEYGVPKEFIEKGVIQIPECQYKTMENNYKG